MKKIIIILFVFAYSGAVAQDSLKSIDLNRLHIQKTGMEVLGSWAIANIATGAILSGNTNGQAKYFYQMNALWNIANLGAAVSGYIGSEKYGGPVLTAAEAIKQQKRIETIFLVNGSLDVLYIGGGIYLDHRGIVNNSDKLKGYGSSIILQGAFLLLFDGTMYTSEQHNGKKLRDFLQRNPVLFDGKKIGMLINL